MHDRNSQWLIPILLAAAAAAALGYYWLQVRAPVPMTPVTPTESTPPVKAPEAAGPRYPMPRKSSSLSNREDLMPLPPLEESDEYFRIDMTELFGSGMAELLADTAVIEKIVATVDNLPRNHVAERIRPIGGIVGTYLADGQDGSGLYTINPENYQRYDFLVNLLANADLVALVEVYRRFYPLFQEAYAGLGYPQAFFNDRAVEVIDHLLATPEIQGPVELVRSNVLYEYADPKLESLSGGQKLMLRMGAENAVRVKQFLEELRAQIVTPAT